MGIIVTKNDDKNTELNNRIAADLRVRAQQTAKGQDPDLVEDSDYAKDLKKTSSFGWIWIVLIILALATLVAIAII